jgi:hypothetical protein
MRRAENKINRKDAPNKNQLIVPNKVVFVVFCSVLLPQLIGC